MSTLTYFTVTGTFMAALKDSPYDVDADPEPTPMSGTVTFTPLIDSGDSLPVPTLSPPANLWLAPVRARIKSGVITTNGVPGVKLVANTGVLELDGDLFYRVEFNDGLLAGGVTYRPKSFVFEAPTSATTLDLVDVTPASGQPASGITKIAPGGARRVGNTVVFSFAGVDIPSAVDLTGLVSTWATIDKPAVVAAGASKAAARAAIDLDPIDNGDGSTTFAGTGVVSSADPVKARTKIGALGLVQAAKNPDLLVTGAITLDSNDLITSAVVKWPDDSPGTLTITSRDGNNAVLAYNITYGSPVTKTYTQPTITRNANGAATNVPAIVVT